MRRYNLHSTWEQDAFYVPSTATPKALPQTQFAPPPEEIPQGLPFIVDPISRPIHQPAPFPRPLPWRVIPHVRPNPERAPGEQDERGPVPVPRLSPGLGPRFGPGVSPGSRTAPFPTPVTTIGGGGTTNSLVRYENAPPAPGEKERKFVAFPRFAQPILGPITETWDAVEAIWNALPEDCKTKHKTLQSMLRDIFDCFERLNVQQAIQNLIANQIEDYVFGLLGKQLAKASRQFGSPVGLQFLFNNILKGF